jgi:hypothetical protein
MPVRLTIGVVAVVVAASTLAACGGDDEAAKAPRIPAAVAERLAVLSDETAAALEAGDDCAAQESADELEREALEADAQIPAELRGQVREGVQRLTASISCEPEPVIVTETVPEETTPEETTTEEDCPEEFFEDDHPGRGHDDEKGKGKGKGKGKHDPCRDDPGPGGHGEDDEGEE